jgi:cytochrome c
MFRIIAPLSAGLCLLFAASSMAMPPGDAVRGKTLFASNCAACHSAAKGAPDGQGPNLWGIYGRKPGQEPGFAYSDDFKKTDFVWDDAHLDKWLTQPASLIPDSYMMYQQPDPQIRADIIAYLKTLKDQ